jgi:hypothetical protein
VSLGHRTVESSAIGPHRQTYALNHQVSRGGAATHIVPSVQQSATAHPRTRRRRRRHSSSGYSAWARACLHMTRGGIYAQHQFPTSKPPNKKTSMLRSKLAAEFHTRTQNARPVCCMIVVNVPFPQTCQTGPAACLGGVFAPRTHHFG